MIPVSILRLHNTCRQSVFESMEEFLARFQVYETVHNVPLIAFHDMKSDACYLSCHLNAEVVVNNSDLEAVLDPTESEDYKFNRDIYTDTYAYQLMRADALSGRSFEDLVVEYDTSYRPEKPLKVFGGQHRIKAMQEATKQDVNSVHGVRVFFGLTDEQRVDIAVANNTSIAVSNDLLDRMQEDLLGSELRNWSQRVGLLKPDQNFADKRNAQGTLTVRIARSLLVNFYLGKNAKGKEFHEPVVCNSGPKIDGSYLKVREKLDWADQALVDMGINFATLHKTQKERVENRTTDKYLEFANKATHPCVAASWAYASGLFQIYPKHLASHYGIVDSVKAPSDPLNAKALTVARLKGVDPDTYRGLGARITAVELGRMLELFILQATRAAKPGITKELANAAIKSYHAKLAKREADKAMKGL